MNESRGKSPPDRVIADPLRFKQRLRIGRKAFRTLQTKDLLQDLWDTAGVAWTGAAVAKSSMVATTFFAPTGIMAWLGLASAATPAGWVMAAALGSAGLYYCVSRRFAGDHRFVDEIPKFINTPLDLLAASLFGLTGTLALKVASVDDAIDPQERAAILDHLVCDWGYDETFVVRELARLEAVQGEMSLEALAQQLADFHGSNPDCNGPAMQKELLAFVEDIIRSDGMVRPEETAALEVIRVALAGQRRTVTRSLLESGHSMLGSAARTARLWAVTAAAKLHGSNTKAL